MKNKNSLRGIGVVLVFCLIFAACKKESGSQPEPDNPVTGKVSPQGISTGPIVTKEIGPEGGEFTLPDQSVSISIPAGALSGKTIIGIEPVTNTNVAGLGRSYRLTPHGIQFAKPVSVTMSYAGYQDSVSMPEALALSYQKEDGIWYCMGSSEVDQAARTITVKTTHFSTWSGMNWIMLTPRQASVPLKGEVALMAKVFIPVHGDILQEPQYNEDGYPVGDPQPLPERFILSWHHAGPGTLVSTSNEAEYVAPASIAAPTTVAVSCELRSRNGLKYLLISNIEIITGGFIELSVGGGAPVTLKPTPVVKTGNRYLLANEDNNGGGYFLLTWTNGIGIHGFDLDNGTTLHWLTSQANYVSMYRPDEEADVFPSGGSVNITRVSNGWAEGTFNADNAGYTLTLVPTTTLRGRFKVELWE